MNQKPTYSSIYSKVIQGNFYKYVIQAEWPLYRRFGYRVIIANVCL